MSKPALVLYDGGAWQSQGMGRFLKDVIGVGQYVHPATGQVINMTPERLQKLATNTEKYRKNVDKQILPFPDGHSMDAMKNLGDWPGPFLLHGEKIYGVVEPKGADVVERLDSKKIRSVSAMIEFGRMDSKGNVYDEVITHVCATPYPVITGQGDFIRLSAEMDARDLYIPQELAGTSPEGNSNRSEGRMDLKKMAKALGLPEDSPAEKILEAAEKANQAATKLSAVDAQQNALTLGLKEQGLEWKDGKLVKLAAPSTTPNAADDAEKAELKKRLATLEESSALSAIGSAKSAAERYISEGRVPPAMRAELERVMSLAGKVEVLGLSADGKPGRSQVDLLQDLHKILGSITKISAIGLSTHAGDGNAEEKKKLDAKADELVKRLQPELAKK